MKRAIVKESKFVLILGIISGIFFFIISIISLISSILDNDIMTFIFCLITLGSFLFLSIYLVISYLRRKLILYDNYFTYTKTLGKTKKYEYSEISSVQILNKMGDKKLIIYKNDKKIVSIENNMVGYKDVIKFFKEKKIKISKFDSKKDGNIFQKIKNSYEDNNKFEIEYIKKNFKINQIKKEQHFVKVFNIVIIICLIISFFLTSKINIIISILSLIIYYILYLYYYPKMVSEIPKKAESYTIPFPFIGVLICIFMVMWQSETINDNSNILFIHTLIYSIIILIPFLITTILKKIKTIIWKKITVFLFIVVISFCTVSPLNYILTFSEPTYEQVTVLEKYMSSSSDDDSYYFTVILNGKTQDVSVNEEIYENTKINDKINICNKESIFGYKYFTVQK
ncbi:hypothetical protein ACTQYZ_01145 [Anaerofustis sp. LCP19S3_F7]|uniref:hypothetical protein n=1 Tax=Anaerofustis sp. LCP19S3_F7 TaxID=3440247 RepID=UPI003F8DEC78